MHFPEVQIFIWKDVLMASAVLWLFVHRIRRAEKM